MDCRDVEHRQVEHRQDAGCQGQGAAGLVPVALPVVPQEVLWAVPVHPATAAAGALQDVGRGPVCWDVQAVRVPRPGTQSVQPEPALGEPG